MLTTDRVDPGKRRDVRRFIDVPRDLYRTSPCWVPPISSEIAAMLDRRRHPFYEHSDAEFFLATRHGRDVGRIGALEIRPYNRVHGHRDVSVTLFECADDQEAAEALVARVLEWAHRRGLTRAVGPRGLSPLDGYGVLVDGFDRRQLMTMTAYNGPWYGRLLEALGFEKLVDFVTYELTRTTFVMPEAVRRAASRAGSTLRVVRFPTRRARHRRHLQPRLHRQLGVLPAHPA